MWRWFFLALAAGCSSPDRVFVATDADFALFLSWESVSLPAKDLGAGHPVAPSVAYLSQRPPPGAKKFPVGTLLVKAFESDRDLTQWDIFATSKRGGGFNPEGARDWEFFRLRMSEHGEPTIVGRGTFAIDPTVDGGSGYTAFGNAIANLCNNCHGTPESAATDHVLTPEFAP